MKIGSKDLYDKIEFSKILDFIKVNCQGSLGRQHFDNIPIFTTKNEIEL